MIPRQPEPPAQPGIITRPPGPVRRAWDLVCRYRWELLPAGTATALGGLVELQAATDPGIGTAVPYILTSIATAPISYGLTKAGHEGMALTAGFASAITAWAAYQTGAGPDLTGVVLLALVTGGSYVPYGKYMAGRRDAHAKMTADVEVAKFSAMKAYAATQIPGQRAAPAIETVPVDGVQPGDFPEVRWPGAAPGKTVADPVRFSPRISISLLGGHVLLGGGTDFGKSGLVHLVCCDVLDCRDAVLMGIDMKPGAVELGIYRHAGARIASTPEDALQLLKDVRAEGKRRGDLLGVTVHPNGELSLKRKWTPTPDDPQWVVVIDELAELVDEVPQAAELLRSHTRLLRSMGITIVAGCQITSKRVFGGDTDGRGQYGTRVCVRTFDAGQTNMIMGQGMHGAGVRPDLLKQPGEFVVISRHHDGTIPDRAYLLTNEVIADHVGRHATGVTAVHRDAEPEAFPQPEPEPKPGRIDNATELITAYLVDHGPATPEEVHAGLGFPSEKLRNVRVLLRRHATSGVYKTSSDGTKYSVNSQKTVTGNVVRFRGRSNV